MEPVASDFGGPRDVDFTVVTLVVDGCHVNAFGSCAFDLRANVVGDFANHKGLELDIGVATQNVCANAHVARAVGVVANECKVYTLW